MRSIFSRVSYRINSGFCHAKRLCAARVISTVAGTGTAGFSGDGGPATAALLNGPSEITIDGKGDYSADRDNHRIRKVDGSTGVITTIIGNGVAGWFFEGGPAKLASLDHPSGVEIDASGNLYIADLLDNGITRLHKVTASNGLIARIDPIVLKGAVAIALDSDGNLYIAEESADTVSASCRSAPGRLRLSQALGRRALAETAVRPLRRQSMLPSILQSMAVERSISVIR